MIVLLVLWFYHVQAIDMAPGHMSERVVNKYLRYATDDMIQNNRREIRCPCRKCKKVGLLNPFREICWSICSYMVSWMATLSGLMKMMMMKSMMVRWIMISMTIITITGKKTKSRLMILPHMMLDI